MDFTALGEIATLVQVFTSLGLVTVLLAYAKYYVETWRWRRYKYRVNDWMNRLEALQDRHPKDLRDQDWRVECERMLSSAYFSPTEIILLLETSVVVAKGIAADRGLLDFT